MSTLDDLLIGALGGIPKLSGNLCRGEGELFDDFEDPEVVEYCLHRCQSCPALTDCQQWVNSRRPSARPHGVVAGQVRRPRRPPQAGIMKLADHHLTDLDGCMNMHDICINQTGRPARSPLEPIEQTGRYHVRPSDQQ